MDNSVFSSTHKENDTSYSYNLTLQSNSKCELDYEISSSHKTLHENYTGIFTTLSENPLTLNCHFKKLVICDDDTCNMHNIDKNVEVKIENNVSLFKKGNPIIPLDIFQY
jgi:hypothetical protein